MFCVGDLFPDWSDPQDAGLFLAEYVVFNRFPRGVYRACPDPVNRWGAYGKIITSIRVAVAKTGRVFVTFEFSGGSSRSMKFDVGV